MNFVKEIVGIVNEKETVDAKKNIIKLSGDARSYQMKVKEYMNTNCLDYLDTLQSNGLLLGEGDLLLKECGSQMDRMDTQSEIFQANDDIQQLSLNLKDSIEGIRLANKLLHADDLFKRITDACRTNNYILAMQHMKELKILITDTTDVNFINLNCYQNMKEDFYINNEMVCYKLKEQLDTLVQFNEKLYQNSKSITIKISKDTEMLADTVTALTNIKYHVQKICEFLMESVFKPIIIKPVSVEYNDQNSDFVTLNLSYSIQPVDEALRPNHKIVFDVLRTTFLCLGFMNISITDSVCIFQLIAQNIKKEVIQLLIDECLAHSIPETMDEMTESTLADDILEFNHLLNELLFIDDRIDEKLPKYAQQIGMLFISHFCTNIEDKAIKIMHKDLHEMTLSTEEKSSKSISQDNPVFSKCMISKSTLELISLIEKILKQADVCDASQDINMKERLYKVVCDILGKYTIEVPDYHEKLLQNLPQHSAFMHNNCMFLAYWSSTICRDPSLSNRLSASIEKLKKCGTEQLNLQVKHQKTMVIDAMKQFNLSTELLDIDDNSHRAVRQGMHQLNFLKNIWQNILPDTVYNQSMGTLVNVFCTELVNRVLSLEDISTQVSNGLFNLFGTIVEKIPQLFHDPTQTQIHIISWMKFIQLRMMLDASLADINEQWSDGKGPLTMNYKAEEVRHLIKALFKNTDRRAVILNKIN